jgi:hypothetical protein
MIRPVVGICSYTLFIITVIIIIVVIIVVVYAAVRFKE